MPGGFWVETGVSLVSPVGYYRELVRFQREHDSRHKRIRPASVYFCTSNINSATAAGERPAAQLSAQLGARTNAVATER